MPPTNPLLIPVGRGDIYVDVPVPVAGTKITLGIDGAPTAGGRFVGSTVDVSTLIYRPTNFDIKSQQVLGVVGLVATEEELRLEFHPGELTYRNLRDLVQGAKDQTTFVSFGGVLHPPLHSVVVVSPRRAGGFIHAMIYQAVMAEDRSWVFSRSANMSPRMVARGIVIPTRDEGDQLGYYDAGDL